jgi:hypothetical protein
MGSNTIFSNISSDVQFDKFKYLFLFLSVIFITHIVVNLVSFFYSEFNDSGTIQLNVESFISNSFNIFIIFSLIYFTTNSDLIFTKNKVLSMLLLIVVFNLMNMIISNLLNFKGYQFINPKFDNVFLIVFLSIIGLLLLNNFLYFGFSYKFLIIPLILFSYIMSGNFMDKKISGWFLSLIPIFMIDLSQNNKFDNIFLTLLSSYIIYSGNFSNFQLYE